MTSAATPKGLRRRARLIAAAGELLLEGGFDAVRHRAVAERADLPLASTTYYFESLEDLLVEAAAHTCHDDEECIRGRAEALSNRRRGAEATAEALADVFVGPQTSRQALTNRIETVVLSTRCERLTPLLDARRKMLAGLHDEVLAKCGRVSDPGRVAQLMAVEDGAVASALAESMADIPEATRLALTDLMDVLAPAAPD